MKSNFLNSVLDKMAGAYTCDVNLIGADDRHIVSFCVRFNDRNHLINRVYVEERTNLMRVSLSPRCDRSCKFDVYAAELTADALETIDLILSPEIIGGLVNGTLAAPASPAPSVDSDDE